MSLGSQWLPTDTCAKFWVLSGGESPTVPVPVSGSGEGPSTTLLVSQLHQRWRRANAFSMAALTVSQASIQTSGLAADSNRRDDTSTF